MKDSVYTRDGFRIFEAPEVKLPLKAAYGIYLIKLHKEADIQGEKEGRFIEVTPITLEEFKQQRKDANRRNLFKHEKH